MTMMTTMTMRKQQPDVSWKRLVAVALGGGPPDGPSPWNVALLGNGGLGPSAGPPDEPSPSTDALLGQGALGPPVGPSHCHQPPNSWNQCVPS